MRPRLGSLFSNVRPQGGVSFFLRSNRALRSTETQSTYKDCYVATALRYRFCVEGMAVKWPFSEVGRADDEAKDTTAGKDVASKNHSRNG